jgi:hypothetical protein
MTSGECQCIGEISIERKYRCMFANKKRIWGAERRKEKIVGNDDVDYAVGIRN